MVATFYLLIGQLGGSLIAALMQSMLSVIHFTSTGSKLRLSRVVKQVNVPDSVGTSTLIGELYRQTV